MKTTDYTFDDFMKAVNLECEKALGCSANDLQDYPYYDDWEICKDDLSYKAPEDVEARRFVFENHVAMTIQDLEAECNVDSAFGGIQGIDY